MSNDRDVTRIVRSWLDEGVTALPDRVLDAVLDQVPTTHQRSAGWLARRSPIMNNTVRIALAAAAVVAVAFIGYQFLGPNVGGPGPSASESPSAAPTATPAPSEVTVSGFPAGRLEVGTRYAVSAGSSWSAGAVSYSLAVPTSGWQSQEGGIGISAGGTNIAANADIWFFDNYAFWEGDGQLPMIPAVLDDPCVHDGLQSQSFEASLAGQAQAIASIPGTELVSGPSDVRVDSRPGQQVTITIPASLGCPRPEFWLMFNESDGPGAFYPNWVGETDHVWLIDVDGEIFTIWAHVRPGDASAGLEAEIQQIVDSVQFE